ncbi:MAG: glycosyltransferase family 39 protein [Patescibacteria group bacterium]
MKLLKSWKNNFVLLLILFLFLFTRLYKINSIPASVYWDEASIGYNAYAISTDLKDEWGEFLPLHIRAFGEFKLPIYIYSVAVLTKLFGINEFTLRIPAVLYSLGTIIALYFLVARITKSKKIGLISSFILIVSPWLFIFSRTGYEATAGLFFFLSFICFLIFHKDRKFYIFLSIVCAILAFYSYNSFRIIIPIFLTVWFLKVNKKSLFTFVALGIFLVGLIPAIKLYYFDQGAVRLTTIRIKEPKTFIKNYFSHFSYNFLFKSGDINNRSQMPGWGEIYLINLPFLLIGIWKIFKSKFNFKWSILLLLIIAPIPASITLESPHALRAIVMAPVLAFVSAIGLNSLKRIWLIVTIFIYLIFFGFYFHDFVTNYNLKTSNDWQYEYKEIFLTTKEGIVTDKYAQPYIFALYYLKYPPAEFRRTVKYNPPDKWGFSTVESFGQFKFIK